MSGRVVCLKDWVSASRVVKFKFRRVILLFSAGIVATIIHIFCLNLFTIKYWHRINELPDNAINRAQQAFYAFMNVNSFNTAEVKKKDVFRHLESAVLKNITLNFTENVFMDPEKGNGLSNEIYGVNPHPYKYVLNHPNICENRGANITLFIMVFSAMSHFDARNSIRHTWGRYSRDAGAKMLFLLGSAESLIKQKHVQFENDLFKDIVQSSFLDSYKNLTIKTISLMKWIKDYCSEVRFVLKVDDDVFINIDSLMATLKIFNVSNAIFGSLLVGEKPIRNESSKFYVSSEQYSDEDYPNYISGPFYLITADCVSLLYNTSLSTPFLYLEDVYMTGLVAEKAGIKRLDEKNIYLRYQQFTPCKYKHLISHHLSSSADLLDIWKLVHNPYFKCLPFNQWIK